jgi:hypothetical protein
MNPPNRPIRECDIAAGTKVHLEGFGLVKAFRIVTTLLSEVQKVRTAGNDRIIRLGVVAEWSKAPLC